MTESPRYFIHSEIRLRLAPLLLLQIKGVVDPVLRRMAVATSLLGSEVPEALKTHDLILVDSPALGTDAEVERILSEV